MSRRAPRANQSSSALAEVVEPVVRTCRSEARDSTHSGKGQDNRRRTIPASPEGGGSVESRGEREQVRNP